MNSVIRAVCHHGRCDGLAGRPIPRRLVVLVCVLAMGGAPVVGWAYIGPGAGLSIIGTLLALFEAVVLGVVGFVWYPVRRLLRSLRACSARAADVDDEVKERRIQEASLTLIGLFLSITLRAAAALVAPALLILSLDYFGAVQSGHVYHTLMSWPVPLASVRRQPIPLTRSPQPTICSVRPSNYTTG